MEGVTFQNHAYHMIKIRRVSKGDLDWRARHLHLVLAVLDVGTAKFIMIGFIQNAIQTNLQATLVGVNYQIGHLDMGMLASVIMCWIGTILDFPDIVKTIKVVRHSLQAQKEMCLDEKTHPHYDELHFKKARQARVFLRSKLFLFLVNSTLYFLVTLWSVFKFAAIFACDSHLWNGMHCA